MAIPLFALALGASAGLSAFGSRNAAIAQRSSLQHQAFLAGKNAEFAKARKEDAEFIGKKTEFAKQRRIKQVRGAQKSALARSGVDISVGTPLDLLGDTDIIGEADIQTIRNNTRRQVFERDIDIFNAKTKQSLFQTGADNINPNLSFATSLLGSAASFGQKFQRTKVGGVGTGSGASHLSFGGRNSSGRLLS